jgi:hypothetical protein
MAHRGTAYFSLAASCPRSQAELERVGDVRSGRDVSRTVLIILFTQPSMRRQVCRMPQRKHGSRQGTHVKGTAMVNNTSPLESLAAFAIVFAVGIVSTVALGKYIDKVRRDAQTAAACPD